MAEKSLISVNEAENVAIYGAKATPIRIPLMLVLGLIMIIVFTLLVMLLLSLRGANTGLSAIFPFLDRNQIQTLQLNGP
jgi:hypothetical protein